MKFSANLPLCLLLGLTLHTGNAWAIDPVPNIKANASDETIAINQQDNLAISISLDPADLLNSEADWWLLIHTPFGWYYYQPALGWQAGISFMQQGALSALDNNEVLNISDLPSGTYTAYFGLDTQVNGEFDLEQAFYDAVTVNISASASVAPNKTYSIVDTQQNRCYDNSNLIACPTSGEAFYGQDAKFTGNMASYTNNGDGTITDNVTGLIWQQSPDTDGDGDIDATDKLGYEAAMAYCENLSLGNHDDWQLPSIKQLYSLMDFNGVDPSGYEGNDTSALIPFINTDYFAFAYGDTSANERIIDSQYASSNLYVVDSKIPLLFGVNFADGRIKGYGTQFLGREKTFVVSCVRANNSYGVNDFQDNGDQTITDNATGLMWAQNDSGSDAPDGLNWEQALAYVESQNAANYLGYNDWRLPNVKELQSLVDYSLSPDRQSLGGYRSRIQCDPHHQ